MTVASFIATQRTEYRIPHATSCRALEVPESTNARGLRELGCIPGIGPGLAKAKKGMDAAGIRDSLSKGELKAVVLWDVDPVRDYPDSEAWKRALEKADESLRGALKRHGLLTRDARKKERKKYGQKGARARYQFSKR